MFTSNTREDRKRRRMDTDSPSANTPRKRRRTVGELASNIGLYIQSTNSDDIVELMMKLIQYVKDNNPSLLGSNSQLIRKDVYFH